MLPELEKPKVTEIQVRMDCNGCVQKIKKALHGINGIYDVYIDIPQQKVTIIGWADPEKIVKAIKKTRKTATICSHTTPSELEPSLEEAPSSDTTNIPREEAPPPEQTPQAKSPLPLEDSQLDVAAPPQPTEYTANQQPQYSRPKAVEEDHVVYRYAPDQTEDVRVYDRQVNHYPGSQGGLGFRHEPLQPIHVNHSYNTYKPTPYITEYQYIQPQPQYTLYSRQEPPQYTSYSWPEPSKQYTNYGKKPSYSRLEPSQPSYNRPEPPPHNYVQLDPSPPRHSQPYLTPSSHNQSQPPPQDRQPGSPQHYTQQESPQQNRQPESSQHYTQPESLQQNYQQEPLQQNYQPEPPQQHTHYNRPEPPRQYTHYYYQEPPQQYTLYGRPEPPPSSPHAYYNRLEPPYSMHYNSAYYQSSNENDDITSAFGDEDPNGCKIV